MARKVFISVLGASFYGECKYTKDNFLSENVRFIQEATLQMLVNDEWKSDSKAYLLTTELARKVNWETKDNERYNTQTKIKEPYESLQYRLNKLSAKFDCKAIDIPDGKNEAELWEIFDILYNLIEEEDELYLELTHSFRYLPMLLLVFGNYVKFLKKAKVVHISYGNYEARDTDINVAPIIDLLPISTLQDWTFAAANYLENGNVRKMASLSKEKLNPILAASSGKDTTAKNLQRFITSLEKVVEERVSCRGISIVKSDNFRLLKQHSDLLENNLIEPLNPIIGKIKESFKSFDENENVQNGFAAVSWCIEFGLYQQAVTILIENIVTYICHKYKLNWTVEAERLLVNASFKVKLENLPESIWKVSNRDIDETERKKLIEIVRNIINGKETEFLYRIFASLSDLRNDFNHAGMRNNPMSPNTLKTALIEKFSNVLEIINQIEKGEYSNSFKFSGIILLNLSNHPHTIWSEHQLQAAREQYGDIEDIAFPVVDPTLDEEGIEQLAGEYLAKIVTVAADKNATPVVHLMGEYTFTFALANKLKAEGIDVVVSTSERQTEMNADGSKTIRFDFVRFRKY